MEGIAGRSGLAVFAALIAGTAFGGAFVWLSQPRSTTYEERLAQLDALDPAIGSRLPLPPDIRKSPEARHMLFLLGNCSGCSLAAHPLTAADLSNVSSITLVSTSGKAESNLLPSARSASHKILSDTELHSTLNAYWTPRLALVRGDGLLLALQRRSEEARDFIERAQSL